MLPAVLLLLACLQDPQAGATPGEPARQYRLGPDDAVRVTVYGHADLSQDVVVESDGTFDFPLIGRVDARDRTPRELEEMLAARLAQGFVRDPQVRVLVQAYRSRIVYAVGELSRPGTYPLPEGRTVIEVLARAGPLLPSAGGEILVQRPGAEVVRIDLKQLQSGAAAANPLLQPGDTVLVPRAARVVVSGEVKAPGAYALLPGTTVRQAISLAGGFARRAARGRIRILRQVDGRVAEIKAALDDTVAADDTIVVERKGLF